MMIFDNNRWWPKSIVSQLIALMSASLIVIFFLSTVFLYVTLSFILERQDTAFLNDRVETVLNLISSSPEPIHAVQKRVELEWASRNFERIYIKIISPQSGSVLVRSPNIPLEVEKSVSQMINETNTVKRFKTPAGVFFGTVRKIQSTKDGLENAVLFAAIDLTAEQTILKEFQAAFVAVLLFLMIISIFLSFRFTRVMFNPVDQMIVTAQNISSNRLFDRINTDKFPTELKNLGSTINDMLNRLSESFDRLSQFSADIAHELRGPINNIQGEIEVTLQAERKSEEYRELVISVLEETQRISRMIDGLLFLSKAENADLKIREETFDLRNEVLNISDYYQASADEYEIDLEVNIPEGLSITCQRDLFQRALSNLISNSIKYSAQKAKIFIDAEKQGDRIVIRVRDNGIGISREHLPFVFDRFFRADPARTTTKLGGYGLGLTIVKSIMTLHKGNVEIDSELGKGTSVTLTFS